MLTVLVLVILLGSRRAAVLALVAGVLYIPETQQIDVLNFKMFSVRFLELAGFIRVVSRHEFSFSRLNKLDRALLLLYAYVAVVFCLRSSESQAYVVGTAVDAWLCYFTFRGLLTDMQEFRWFLRAFVVLLAPYAALVMIESLTRHNMFSLLGGGGIDWERDGRFRCMGSFRHPDLLGTLGASFLPLYIALARERGDQAVAAVAIASCLATVWASNSGGPVCAAAFGLVGWALWVARANMRSVRWGLVIGLVLTAIVMKAPIWYLIARVSTLTGGTGWHRAYLIDVAFQHLGEWWLAGMPLRDTIDWFPYYLVSTGGTDVTNQFIAAGLTAGVGAMALLIFLLKQGFSSIGEAAATVRSRQAEPGESEFVLWGLGVMLTVHAINWLGITYFDQFYVLWFMQLAIISSVTEKLSEISPIIEADEAGAWPEQQEVVWTDTRSVSRHAVD
jgi:hypothetical protein